MSVFMMTNASVRSCSACYHSTTTATSLWEYFSIFSFFEQNGLDMKHVCMLVTDEAPSMAGKISGLVVVFTLNRASDGVVRKTKRAA